MRHLIMGTAGHVDHGKTSLIKALTNIDCDTHKEEKERGITINLGFSHIDLPSGNSLGIIDVPGHKDFINTMVGGACGIDFVLLVIAADSGVMPQTIEHFNIIRALKVKKAIIVLNKIDLVDEELAELAKMEIMEWLEDTEFKDSPIVGVSSTSGQGLDELIKEIDLLIPHLSDKKQDNFFRMFVDRIFTVKGMGSVVTGSVLNGEISMGKDLFLLPGRKQKLRIRSIERHGKATEKVVSGDRAAFNLTGLKTEDFKRGMLLSNKEMEATKMIDAHIVMFENAMDMGVWSTVLFHSGTFESQGRMHLLNKDKVKPGDEAIVQIILEKESVLINKDKFILRNTSGDKSIAGGIIIDAQALHHRKRTPKLINDVELLASGILNEGNIRELIKIELKKEKLPLSIIELGDRLHKTREEILEEAEGLNNISFYKNEKTELLLLASLDEFYQAQVLDYIKEHHEKNNILKQGLEENELYGKLGFTKNPVAKAYLSLLMNKLNSDGKIKAYHNTWALSHHLVEIDAKTKQDLDWLEFTIKEYGMKKPVYKDINTDAQEKKISIERLKLYYKYLMIEGVFIHYKEDYLHIQNVDEIRQKVLSFLQSNDEGYYIKEIRDETGLTKKLAPIILELYKDEGLITTSDYSKGSFNSVITEKGKNTLNTGSHKF